MSEQNVTIWLVIRVFFFLINPFNEKPETQKLKARHVFECFKIRWMEKEFEDKKLIKYEALLGGSEYPLSH